MIINMRRVTWACLLLLLLGVFTLVAENFPLGEHFVEDRQKDFKVIISSF